MPLKSRRIPAKKSAPIRSCIHKRFACLYGKSTLCVKILALTATVFLRNSRQTAYEYNF